MRTPSLPGSRRLRRAVLGASGLALAGAALAHDPAADPLPATPGWRVGAAVAVTAIGAQAAIPSPTLPGVLDTGVDASDRRGLGLEHATLAAGVRLNSWLGANLAVGWHVDDPVHVEAAWLQARQGWGDGEYSLGLGIAKVPMGQVLGHAGDYGRFSLVPLVKRASLNEDWFDEGGAIGWRAGSDTVLREVNIGLWRGVGFPGGGDLPPVPTVHVQLGLGELELDGFYAYLQPDGRGTLARGVNSPHTHDVPNCNVSMTGLVCFDGRVNMVGASVNWASHDWPVTLTGAILWRDEKGSLYSQLGDARYHGQTLGGWADAVWDINDRWQLAARYEALSTTQQLTGPGAVLVAVQAGLLPSWPASRAAVALAYSPDPAWRLSAELGNERTSGENNAFVMLRAIWSAPWLLSGSW